ncbi:hypothetical protein ASG92_26855 [Arthrobacter sp. Soil736]|nr:hypothetical protein ASG92_26855 [Arthrobacter sp. Soil736]
MIGLPHNVVNATALTRDALLEGIRQGRSWWCARMTCSGKTAVYPLVVSRFKWPSRVETTKVVRGERDWRAGIAQARMLGDEIEDAAYKGVGENVLRGSDQSGEQVRQGVAEDFLVGVVADGGRGVSGPAELVKVNEASVSLGG